MKVNRHKQVNEKRKIEKGNQIPARLVITEDDFPNE